MSSVSLRPAFGGMPMTRRSKVVFALCAVAILATGGRERGRGLPRRQQAPPRRPHQRVRRYRDVRARAGQLRELRVHDDRTSRQPRHHQAAGGQHGCRGRRQPDSLRSRPRGRAGDPVHPGVVLLAPHPDARGPQVATGVHPPHLPDPVHGGGLPEHHRLVEPDHQPARGDPRERGRDDARGARGDAHRPRADQDAHRLDLRVGDRARSATRSSTSSRITRSSRAVASRDTRGRSRSRIPSRSI